MWRPKTLKRFALLLFSKNDRIGCKIAHRKSILCRFLTFVYNLAMGLRIVKHSTAGLTLDINNI
jgi:hypothetical protein